MIFSNKNFIDPNQVGLDNYYITYCKLHISKSRDFLETVFKDYFDLLFKNDKNPQIKKIINKCFKNGIKLDLPILKIKGKSKDDNWLFNFEQNKIIENVDVYDFLISNEYVSIKDKSKLDILLFQSLMADLILLRYKKHEVFYSKYLEEKAQRANDLSIQYNPINEIENIIHRGYVFKTQISRFLMLSYLFNKDIFYGLNIHTKLTCYQEFQKLSVIGKKTLAAILIKNKNEEAIFNLLKYGLKLNWDIVTNEGKKNLIAFEMLYSLKWVKTIIEHKFLDIRLTNLDGENILHLIGSGALEDISIENSLRRKINELNKLERENLFFQNKCRRANSTNEISDFSG